MIKKTLFLLCYFLAPILLIAAIFSSNPGYYGSSGFFPMLFGAIAYTWLNAQLVLSARPKWIESSFGLDRFYRFHGMMAVISIAFALVHKQLKEQVFSESLKTQFGDLAVGLFLCAAVLSLIFMTDTLVQRIQALKKIRTFFEKTGFGAYHVQLILHNVNFVALVLVFVHVMMTRSAGNPLVRSLYFLYFAVSAGFYLYHKVLRRYLSGNWFMVEEVVPESDSISTLVLRPEGGSVFPYKPGQFGFIRVFDKVVSAEEHPFTISSQPADKKRLTVTIKNLGDWTSGVRRIQPGSSVLLDAPYGRFSPVLYRNEGGIVLIAGGVGITPMLSILRYYSQADPNQKILLFWGVKNRDELICRSELEAFLEKMKGFVFFPVASNDPDFEGEKGYITREILERGIQKQGCDLSTLQFYFCGPAPMWAGIHSSLKAMSIKKSMVHRENFSL